LAQDFCLLIMSPNPETTAIVPLTAINLLLPLWRVEPGGKGAKL